MKIHTAISPIALLRFASLPAVMALIVSGCILDGQGSLTASPSPLAATAPVPRLPDSEDPVLHIANWPDYLPEGVLEDFERESGIKVHYRTFKSNEDLMGTLSNSSDDLVVPSSNFAAVQIDKKLLQALDKSTLKRLVDVDPSLNAFLSAFDPGNRYLVPWTWGYTTVGINTARVAEALGDLPMPANAWDLLFKPEYARKLSQCGIGMMDSPTDVVPAALHYLGRPLNTSNPEDLQATTKLLMNIRPYVRTFSTSLVDGLAEGRLCAVLGRSGYMNAAKAKAAKNGSPESIEVLMPTNGAIVWADTLAIPGTAKHPRNAHAFIDFFLRPDVAAAMSTRLHHPTVNKVALAQLPFSIQADKVMYPVEQDMRRMVLQPKLDTVTRAGMFQVYAAFAYGIVAKK